MRRAIRLAGLIVAALLVGCPALTAHAGDQGAGEVADADRAFRAAVSGLGGDEERLDVAALLYERALATRPENGALEYDCANAQLLSGDVGRAVLHYRRAARWRPGDERIVTNLAIARTRRRDRIAATSTRSVVETVAFWHRGLPLPTKVPLALAAWMLSLSLFALRVLVLVRVRGVQRSRALRYVAVLSLGVAGAVGASAWLEARELHDPAAAVVVADEVPLRSGDGDTYPSRYEQPVHAGAEVHVRAERGGWSELELTDGKSGWVPSASVERVVQSAPPSK